MLKITQTQKKIITVASISLGVLFVLWIFLYIPSRNKMNKLKNELAQIENEIKTIEAIIGKGAVSGQRMQFFQEKFDRLNRRLPSKEEPLLKQISGFAKEMNIELISIRPQPKRVFLDQGKQKVTVEGKTAQVVMVALSFRSSYLELVKYIEKLKNDLPAVINFDRLSIRKYETESNKLEINLQLNLYLLS